MRFISIIKQFFKNVYLLIDIPKILYPKTENTDKTTARVFKREKWGLDSRDVNQLIEMHNLFKLFSLYATHEY